jgi:alkylation response protein AidB-like acyl-CoA dehydrogenase
MNFETNEDQRAFLDAVAKLAAGHAATPAIPQRLQLSEPLERDLAESGFFEAMQIEELGPVSATAMVIALSRLPLCTELAASALVAPWLCPELPRPFAVLWERDDAPVRFLPVARTLIRVRDGAIHAAVIGAEDVTAVESLFAYPMGVLKNASSLRWQTLQGDANRARDLWRIGIAAELAGCLGAALDSVLDHVKERRQFGRPLGAFQAVQHRLAECATRIEGAKWLALHAASTGASLDAALAAGQAQEIARTVAYDLHQFMGAMGLTLEHPLHRWTYRTKLLASDLGGAPRQFAAAARQAWPTPEQKGNPQ